MIFETQPDDIKRLAVVLVVSFRFFAPTHGARLSSNPAVPDGVTNRCSSCVFFWVTMTLNSLEFCHPSFPLIRSCPAAIVGSNDSRFVNASILGVLFAADFAFVKKPISHSWMLVKAIQFQKFATLDAVFHA